MSKAKKEHAKLFGSEMRKLRTNPLRPRKGNSNGVQLKKKEGKA